MKSFPYALGGIVLGLLICANFFSRPALQTGISVVVHLGNSQFTVPSGYALKRYTGGVASHDVAILFAALLPNLTPGASALADDHPNKLLGKLITGALSFNGPSYASKEMAQLFLKTGTAPSGSEKVPGYDVKTIAGDQDLYVSRTASTKPYVFICSRVSGRPGDERLPSCWTVEEVDSQEYPRKPDGRFPLTVEYTFPRSSLQRVQDINRSVIELIMGWKNS